MILDVNLTMTSNSIVAIQPLSYKKVDEQGNYTHGRKYTKCVNWKYTNHDYFPRRVLGTKGDYKQLQFPRI